MKLVLFALAFLCASGMAVGIRLTPVVSGLQQPIFFTQAPGDSTKFYAVLQGGKIVTVENGKTTPFLDVSEKIVAGGEMGLLGLAFHPEFQRNQRFFVNYTVENPDLTSVVAEFRTGETSGRELLTVSQPFTNHNGGALAFDRHGHLFLSFGDGGNGGDPQGNGQNTQTLLGKILRIGVDGIENGQNYTIPADNPFAQGGGRPEIYAHGLRNVWRFSFDRLTGALFAGDVGQNAREEIDIIEKGKNYGWNTMEGTACFRPTVNCDTTGLTLPIFEYPRTAGKSITGGYVYRGTKHPALSGVYIYGDFISQNIWGLTYDQTTGKVVKNELLLRANFPVSSFGEDNAGELYVVSYSGTVYKIDASE